MGRYNFQGFLKTTIKKTVKVSCILAVSYDMLLSRVTLKMCMRAFYFNTKKKEKRNESLRSNFYKSGFTNSAAYMFV